MILGWALPSRASDFVPLLPRVVVFATGRASKVEYATSIWSTAIALSNGETGTCALNALVDIQEHLSARTHYTYISAIDNLRASV